MKRIDFIFVNTERNIQQKIVGAVITNAEHGEEFNSHVAIRFPEFGSYGPKIVEALNEGFVMSEYDKYKIDPKIAYITIEVSDEEYYKMMNLAIMYVEQKYRYGWFSCVLGFVADNMSRRLAKFLSKITNSDTDKNIDCSEAATNIIRTKVKDFCGDLSAAAITPEYFFDHMLIAGYQKRIRIVGTQFSTK